MEKSSWVYNIIENGGYGVNIHDIKISYIQVNSKQRNSALIAVLVTVRPSTWSKTRTSQ